MEAYCNTSFITALDSYRLHAEFNWADTHSVGILLSGKFLDIFLAITEIKYVGMEINFLVV